MRSTVQQASVSSAAQTGSTPDADCLVRHSVHCRRLKRAYRRRQSTQNCEKVYERKNQFGKSDKECVLEMALEILVCVYFN